jgi:hypothetical protein
MSSFIICGLVCNGCCGGDNYNREKYAELDYIASGKISNAWRILFGKLDYVEVSE